MSLRHPQGTGGHGSETCAGDTQPLALASHPVVSSRTPHTCVCTNTPFIRVKRKCYVQHFGRTWDCFTDVNWSNFSCLGIISYTSQYSRNNQNMHFHTLHLTSVRANFWVRNYQNFCLHASNKISKSISCAWKEIWQIKTRAWKQAAVPLFWIIAAQHQLLLQTHKSLQSPEVGVKQLWPRSSCSGKDV